VGGSGGVGGGTAGAGGGSTSRLTEYAVPGELGPYPIGFVTMPFIDENRPELSTTDPADNRTLPSVVWYPAGEAARTAPRSTYADYFTPTLVAALSALAPPGFLETQSNSVEGAALADDGPFPVIVFSHGNGGIGVQSYFLTEFLGSHGYIVVCPDHTGNALLTELPGGITVGPGGQDGTYTNAAQDRVADVSFLVDAMGELGGSDPEGRFTDKVDLERVGLTGHSFGGLTTLLAMEQDDRFDVGSPLAPAAPAPYDIQKPLMYFWGTEDQTLELAPVQAHYDVVTGPKMLISIIDAGHFSFSNGCPLGIGGGDGCGTATRATGETFTFIEDVRVHAITKHYQTALWGFYLKGVDAYADDLLAEPFAPDVTIQRDGMP
jgi:predicted dienelactone hydrolase